MAAAAQALLGMAKEFEARGVEGGAAGLGAGAMAEAVAGLAE